MSRFEINSKPADEARVDVWYPDLTSGDRPRVVIDLVHVRAVEPIAVEFDGPRSGWVVYAVSGFDDDGQAVWVEHSFVPGGGMEEEG